MDKQPMQRTKEIRFKYENLEVREAESGKMILEGYPIVFDREAYVESYDYVGYEKIDKKAFDNCDMSDVCLKYNHNDNLLILARTRNNSLQLTIDDKGVFARAELIDTTDAVDVYKMVKAGLLTEGSFAFYVRKDTITTDAKGVSHRIIEDVSYLGDVAICPQGAYGSLTEWIARSKAKLDNKVEVDTESNVMKLKLRNRNILKILGGI